MRMGGGIFTIPELIGVGEDTGSSSAESNSHGSSQGSTVDDGNWALLAGVVQCIGQQQAPLSVCVVDLQGVIQWGSCQCSREVRRMREVVGKQRGRGQRWRGGKGWIGGKGYKRQMREEEKEGGKVEEGEEGRGGETEEEWGWRGGQAEEK